MREVIPYFTLNFVLYAQVYITSLLVLRSAKSVRPVLFLLVTAVPYLLGLERIAYYKNSWADVIGGWILGAIIAVYLVSFIWLLKWKHRTFMMLRHPVLILLVMAVPYLLDLERIAYYKNSWADVIGGWILGAIIAVYLVSFIWLLKWKHRTFMMLRHLVLILLVMAVPYLLDLERIAYYKNRWADVIGGWILGATIAVYLVSFQLLN